MCFRPAAVEISGDTATSQVPEYRVAAMATTDINENFKKTPIVIDSANSVTWEVKKDPESGMYIATGAVTIPLEMRFKLNEETNELEKQRVVVKGRTYFDAKNQIDEKFDPLSSVDTIGAQAEAFARFSRAVKG